MVVLTGRSRLLVFASPEPEPESPPQAVINNKVHHKTNTCWIRFKVKLRVVCMTWQVRIGLDYSIEMVRKGISGKFQGIVFNEKYVSGLRLVHFF